MATVVYYDQLLTGADMSMLDSYGVGQAFNFKSHTPVFNQYDSKNNIGLTFGVLTGNKAIQFISTYYRFLEDQSINLAQISYLNANNDEVISISHSPYIYEGEDPGPTKRLYYGDDSIVGNKYNDYLRGGDGMDGLYGNAGNDTLLGDDGNDYLTGGVGNDKLVGGTGRDILRGGSGADSFIFNGITETSINPDISDLITDFNAKQKDIIDLSRIDAISSSSSNDKFTFIGSASFTGVSGQLRFHIDEFSNSTSVLILSGDVNGDMTADFGIAIAGIASINSSGLIM
jgi:Ca2+-binding RTX toxin-like protein